jgi:hypothetical protein
MAARIPPGGVSAAGALVVYTASVVVAVRTHHSEGLGIVVVLGLALLLAGVMLRRGELVAVSTSLVAVVFIVERSDRPMAIGSTTLFAILLLAVLELAFRAIDRAPVATTTGRSSLVALRDAVTLLAGGAAAAVGAGVAADAGRGSGTWLLLIGAPAALAVVAAVDYLAGGHSSDSSSTTQGRSQ